MDARDIREEVPVVQDGRYLEKIYELQKELIDHYVKIEGLPQYPIDVNTKKNQVIIKDFVGRVVEELAEGYESMNLIDGLCFKNRFWVDKYSDGDLSQCLNHLQNVSEEMADAMHFMVELLIYVNIQPEDILEFLKKQTGDSFEKVAETVGNGFDIIHMCMMYGWALLMAEDITFEHRGINLLGVDPEMIMDFDVKLYQAASIYNHNDYGTLKAALWEVTYHLNIARNFLKNKPWKQSQMMTDEIKFQSEIVKAFIKMMGVYKVLNLDSSTLFHIYFKKNRANAFRIRSNY